MYMSPEYILTDEEESMLMGVRDSIRDNYFLVGRIANNKLKTVAQSQEEVSYKQCYHAIGRIIGKSDRTVRYYAEVEAFYPVSAQQEYDILPFAHFDYARGFENWQEVLNYAMEHPSYSLGAIKREFSSSENSQKSSYTPQNAEFEFTNTISELCDSVQDLGDQLELLAMEMDDLEIEQEVNHLNGTLKQFTSQARGFLARMVDRSHIFA